MSEQIAEILAFVGAQMSVNEAVAREINELKRRLQKLEDADASKTAEAGTEAWPPGSE